MPKEKVIVYATDAGNMRKLRAAAVSRHPEAFVQTVDAEAFFTYPEPDRHAVAAYIDTSVDDAFAERIEKAYSKRVDAHGEHAPLDVEPIDLDESDDESDDDKPKRTKKSAKAAAKEAATKDSPTSRPAPAASDVL